MARKPLDDPNPTAGELEALAAYRKAAGRLARAWAYGGGIVSDAVAGALVELFDIDGFQEEAHEVKQVQKFEANDGALFETEEECAAYEAELRDALRVTAYLDGRHIAPGRQRTRIAGDVSDFLAWERSDEAPQIAD